MTQRQYGIRVGLDGKAEINRDFDDIEQRGEGAAENIGRAFDTATTSVGNFKKSAKESAAVFETFGKSGGGVTTAADFDKTLQRLKSEQTAIVSAQKQAQMAIASQSSFNQLLGVDRTSAGSAAESARAFQQQFDAMEEIARAKAQQIGQTFQTTLNESFGIGASGKSARDSASAFAEMFAEEEKAQRDAHAQMMREAKEFFDEYHALQDAKAQQIGQAFQSSLNQSFGIGAQGKSARESASVFEEEAKRMEELETRATALKARIDPLGVAQAKLAAEIKNADELLAANKLTMEQHTVAVAMAQRSYDVTSKSIGKMTAEARLNSFQISNLTFQMNDVISGLAMGQKPLSILTQQGGQIIQVFAGTGMGVTGALKAVGATLLELLSPTVLLSGALIGVGAAAAYILYTNWQASRQLEAATEGLGRASGATAGDLALLSQHAAESGKTTVSAARDMATSLAETGVIGKESISGLTDLWEQYWRKTGDNSDEARDKFISAFKDPAKAGLEFIARLGELDDKTAQYVKTLVDQGEYQKAQEVIQKGVSDGIKDMTDKTIALGDAWRYVKQRWSEGIDQFRPRTPQEILSNLKNELKLGVFSRDNISGYSQEDYAQIQAAAAKLQAEVDAAEAKAAADRAGQEAKTLSNMAGPVARKATPGFEDQFNLSTSADLLGKLVNNKQALGLLGLTADQATDAYNRLNRASDTYLNENEKAESSTYLQIEALKHFSVASRANDAALQTRLALSGAVLTKEEESRREQMASQMVYAQAGRQIAQQTIQLNMSRDAAISAGDAYLKNAAAGMMMEARAKAAAESFQDGVNIEMRTRQLLREQVAQEYASGAKQVSQLGIHADAQKKVNDALAAGTLTIGDANEQMQIEVALANLRIARALALAQGYTAEAAALQKVIDKLPAAYANDNAEARRTQALRTIASQNDQITLAKRELDLQNATEEERAVELAQLRAKQQLLQQGISATSKEGQEIIANAGKIERVNRELELAQASRGELESSFDSLSSTFSDFIVQGEYDWNSFAEAGLSAMKDIESEIIKLAAINPLKNMLFGTNLPTWGSVGGVFGSLFGGGSAMDESVSVTGVKGLVLADVHHLGNMIDHSNDNRMVPANLVRFAPRAHDGLQLNPDERVIVAQTGERVLNRAETRRYNSGQSGPVYVTQNIQTPNPRAFQASKGQTMASLVRGIRAAASRM